ncbi:MAG: hypothetical protein DWQ05_19350 [Calditrichaeota bacterium]|nr:MAG: hypothetical protein DWQ05_19350 [Calditrichota bacterium]
MRLTFLAFLIIILLLSCSDDIVVPVNSPPEIHALVADSTIIEVNSIVVVKCIATDPEEDKLNYEWISAPGTIKGEGAAVCFVAPDVGANFPIICRVTDEHGNSSESRISISVFGNESPIYQLVLDYFNGWNSGLIICDTTSSIIDNEDELRFKKYLFEPRYDGLIYGLDINTYDDYKSANQIAGSLHNYPYWNSNQPLLSTDEFSKIFGHKPKSPASCDGWDKLDATHPGDFWRNSLLFVSKAGFNPERNQSLIYVAHAYRYATFWYFFILQKDTYWKLEHNVYLGHGDHHCLN